MTTTRKGGRIVRTAGADLSEKQYFIVKRHSTAEQVVLSAAGSDNHLGVLQNAPESGDVAEIMGRNSGETSKVKAGGTLTPGCYVTSDGNGKAVATTTEDDQVVGKYLGDTNAASGDLAEIEMVNYALPPAS